MGALSGFAPLIVFAVLTRFASATVSLWAAAAVSAGILVCEGLRSRSVRIPGLGTFALFAMLGFYSRLVHPDWETEELRAVVNGGVLLIVVLSLVMQRPFTQRNARERVPAEVKWTGISYDVTRMWAAAMAVIVLAKLVMHFAPGMPVWLCSAATAMALGGASWFTAWYPQQRARLAGNGGTLRSLSSSAFE